MAAAAQRREHRHERGSSPRLRLVHTARPARSEGRKPTSSRGRACQIARCRRGFYACCMVFAVVGFVAFARVQLTVRAAEIALTTNTLRQDIESERIRNEVLENNRMSLAAPARIEGIAGDSMGMELAQNVAYLDLAAAQAPVQTHVADAGTAFAGISGRLGGLISTILRTGAAEKQVSLAGATGLASAR